MDDFFRILKIKNNIYKIWEPWFTEHANIYFIKGKKYNLLIDCGLGIFNLRDYLKDRGLNNFKVILTHAHFDHAGGIRHFYAEECNVTKKVLANLKKKNFLAVDYLKEKYFDKRQIGKLTIKDPTEIIKKYKLPLLKIKPLKKTSLDLGNYNFKIIGAPGHSDDSIILYEQNKKILITGDVLYQGNLIDNFVNSSVNDYRRTFGLIKKLNFNLVLPGHNNILNNRQALKVINQYLSQKS